MTLFSLDLNDSISGHPSIYDDDDDDYDDSRNFRLSDCANASNIGDTDINMESVDENREKIERKEDGMEASPRVTPRKYNASLSPRSCK